MILRIILFVLFLLIIAILLFFITCILSPAVSEQTGITDNFLLSKAEYNFKKLGKLAIQQAGASQVKAVVKCSCHKTFSEHPEVQNYPGLSCAVIASEYGSIGGCNYMCIGKGDCAAACPQRAITIMNGTAVISNFCIGCGKCIPLCPKGIIQLVDKSVKKMVVCSNTDQPFTTCSSMQKEEIIEEPVKKYFKIWASCYRIIDAKKK